jgi:hypothetical protein
MLRRQDGGKEKMRTFAREEIAGIFGWNSCRRPACERDSALAKPKAQRDAGLQLLFDRGADEIKTSVVVNQIFLLTPPTRRSRNQKADAVWAWLG